MVSNLTSSYLKLSGFSLFCHAKFLLLAIILVFLYKKLRPYFPARVNCWFCRASQTVPYTRKNCFTCISCQQYNGFKSNGDYNTIIKEQYCWPGQSITGQSCVRTEHHRTEASLCHECNLKQHRKLEKLNIFLPNNERHFDEEYKVYSKHLEKVYGLCDLCTKRTSMYLQKQDIFIQEMYCSTPMVSRSRNFDDISPHIDILSPVSSDYKEQQRSRFQNSIELSLPPPPPLFPRDNKHVWAMGNPIVTMNLSAFTKLPSFSSSLSVTLTGMTQLINIVLSIIVFLFIASECSLLQLKLAEWLALHPRMDGFIRFLLDQAIVFAIFGNCTQFAVTRVYFSKCPWHVCSCFFWLVSMFLSYNTSHVCSRNSRQIAQVVFTLMAIINCLMSVICFLKEIFKKPEQNHSRRNSSGLLKSHPQNKSGAKSEHDVIKEKSKSNKIENRIKNKDQPTSIEESNKLLTSLHLDPKKVDSVKDIARDEKESFLFFNHEVKADEFKERLKGPQNNPGTDEKVRPLISPPKLTATRLYSKNGHRNMLVRSRIRAGIPPQ